MTTIKPYPGVKMISPLDSMICKGCGRHRVNRYYLDRPEYRRVTVGERINCHPDDRSEAETVCVCPRCGAVDSFIEVD